MPRFRVLTGFLLLGLLPLSGAAQSLQEAEDTWRKPVLTLRFNALGFINKARGQAELTVGQIGLGMVGSYYYAGAFGGPKAEAYGRYYTGRRLAEGFYVQAKGGVGRYEAQPVYSRVVTSYDGQGFLRSLTIDYDYDPGPQRFTAAGGGSGVGYQFRLGQSRRVVVDAYVGLQYVPLPKGFASQTTTVRDASGGRVVTELRSKDLSDGEWYGIGPGSILNSMVSIGYTFGGRRLGELPDGRRYRQTAPTQAEPGAPVRKASLGRPQPWATR